MSDDALDHFVLSAGLASGGPLSDEGRSHLLNLAVGFRRAGGTFSWDDWCRLSPSTREVFEEAFCVVEGERMAVLCRALGVPLPQARRNPTAPENRGRSGTPAADDPLDVIAEELADKVAARKGG